MLRLQSTTFTILGLWALASVPGCGGDTGNTDASTTQTSAVTDTDVATTETGETGETAVTEGTETANPSGSESGTDTGAEESECVVDSDCQKVDNCCECSSMPADQTPDACDMDCLVGQCTATSLEPVSAVCRSGRCEFDSAIPCAGPVACDSLPPDCEVGMVPSVVDECWGGCVPYHYCADTSLCMMTCGENWVCVGSQAGNGAGCAPLPSGCEGQATCDCFADYWSEVCPSSCFEDGGSLVCADGG